MIKRFTLPPTFWNDHADRCADHDGQWSVVRESKRAVVVDLDAVALLDLWSDADLYDGMIPGRHIERDYAGLIASARATLRALQRQGLPPYKHGTARAAIAVLFETEKGHSPK